MADEIVSRKDLLRQIDKIKLDDWIRAAEKLGLEVTQSGKGSSHYAIRKPGYAKEDLKGLITVVYAHLHKQDKPKCLKRLIVKGEIAEDNVWKALGLL